MKRLLPFLLLCGLAFSVTPPADAYQTSAAKEKKAEPKAADPGKPLPAGPAIPVRFVPRVRTGPAISLPEEATGDVAAFIMVPASTDGTEVVWDTPDQGLSVFPSDLLKSTKTAVVSSAKPGRYRLWAWTAVGGKATTKSQCWIVVGAVPPTPVPPGPVPPDPDPTPSVAPIAGDGFKVLIVYETEEVGKLPKAQSLVLYSQIIRDYLNSKSPVGPDGKTKEWRIYDQNISTAGESKVWQDAMARKRDSVPWIVISNGKTGYEGPLPLTVDATMELLKKWGDK